MKFLVPTASSIPDNFGVMTSTYHRNVVKGIASGLDWAADNGSFIKKFDPDVFFPWLERMKPYKNTCLFIVVPDIIKDPAETFDSWNRWIKHFNGWPTAYVAQDGQENLPMPSEFNTLFIGGSTEWKTGQGAVDCIKQGQAMGKHIHIGRVNWKRRYDLFAKLDGSKEFTCDGTRVRYDGRDRTLRAWTKYMEQD